MVQNENYVNLKYFINNQTAQRTVKIITSGIIKIILKDVKLMFTTMLVKFCDFFLYVRALCAVDKAYFFSNTKFKR